MKAFDIIKKAISRLVYPEGLTCAVCESELDESSRNGLCPDCFVPFVRHCCARCGTVLHEKGREYCDRCLKLTSNDNTFDLARAPYPYEEESVHKLVWNLKYGKQPYYAKLMAPPMAELLGRSGIEADIMTYVPLHPKKQRLRTYNQSELLARHISEITGLPLVPTLKKTVFTKTSATKLGKSDREKLLAGSFAVTADVKGKRVLLIDDVFTSGATASECAKILKAAKAKAVYVLTYATSRGDKPATYDPDEDYIAKLRGIRAR